MLRFRGPAISGDRPTANYIPTLDGWRALSILAVVLFHDHLYGVGSLNTRWVYTYGYLGVDIFFAISGILICCLLLAEESSRGTIGLRSFYLRRFFRIVPPMAAYMATLVVLKYAVDLPIRFPEILSSLLFVHNYPATFGYGFPYYTVHMWSLSVEEHFYLILPALLCLTRRRWRVPSLMVLIAAVEMYRFTHRGVSNQHTEVRLDALLIPAMFAVLIGKERVREQLRRWLWLWGPCALVFFGLLVAGRISPFSELYLVTWLFPLFVLGTMLRPGAVFSRILEWAPLRYIGRLSYSIYLWHTLFITSHFSTPARGMGALQQWPWNYCMIAICSIASFYLIELPANAFGRRLAGRSLRQRERSVQEEAVEILA